MTEGVTAPNSSQTVLSRDYDKNKKTVNPFVRRSVVPKKDEVVIQNKPVNSQVIIKKKKSNWLPSVALIIGAAASAIISIFFLKSLIPKKAPDNLKDLHKRIEDANLPESVKVILRDAAAKYKNSVMDFDNLLNFINNSLKLNLKNPRKKLYKIDKAQEILDESHKGLKSVKDEIINFLTVQNYNMRNNIKSDGPLIICLDGPPGVGKTSIAESIAKAMNRKFARVSLAGANNKSFIKGSERLYRGSEPGHIIKALQNTGVSNPVVLLDEIDKMGRSIEHGDPAYALLDALEPKQCKNFTDDYLDFPVDLSNVTFVITSNNLKHIPDVLKDRLSVIHIPTYGKAEKMDIAKFTIEKMMKSSNLSESQVKFKDDGIAELVEQTNDKGARSTIENLKSVFNQIKIVLESKSKKEKINIDRKFVKETLANRKNAPSFDDSDPLLNEGTVQDLFNKLAEGMLSKQD